MLVNVAIASVSNLSSVGFPACGNVRVPRVVRADRLLAIGAILLQHIGSSWRTEFLSYLSLWQLQDESRRSECDRSEAILDLKCSGSARSKSPCSSYSTAKLFRQAAMLT
jgi:hypothetical protein